MKKIICIVCFLYLFVEMTFAQTVTLFGVDMEYNGYTVVEPESNVDIQKATFADFDEKFFATSYPVTKETYALKTGEEVTHIHSNNPGQSIYIVAGVHGDERAAWYAGLLLKNATIKEGDLYILAPANEKGAKSERRYVTKDQDLNRSFPGNEQGNDAERIASAIFKDIADKQPDLVLDLHEAIIYKPDARDFLGSSYIFTILDGIEDLFFDMLFATQDGELCHNEFGYNGPGPIGSINNSVSTLLKIPTITVETFRGFSMDRRVYDQLDTVYYIFTYLGLV